MQIKHFLSNLSYMSYMMHLLMLSVQCGHTKNNLRRDGHEGLVG